MPFKSEKQRKWMYANNPEMAKKWEKKDKKMKTQTIKNKIEKSGFKKKYIADKLGITNVLLSYYLNEKRKMPEHIKAKLRGFLNV